jgi:hypothetical protein
VANKTNIYFEPVDVYIAAAGTDVEDLDEWQEIGWCRGGSKLESGGDFTRKMNGFFQHLGAEYIFRAEVLETNTDNITALEAFVNTPVDFLLLSRKAASVKYHLSTFDMTILPEFPFTRRQARLLKLEARRTTEHLSDCFERLVAGGGMGDIFSGGLDFDTGGL